MSERPLKFSFLVMALFSFCWDFIEKEVPEGGERQDVEGLGEERTFEIKGIKAVSTLSNISVIREECKPLSYSFNILSYNDTCFGLEPSFKDVRCFESWKHFFKVEENWEKSEDERAFVQSTYAVLESSEV